MSFVLSKVLWALTAPDTLLLLALVLGVAIQTAATRRAWIARGRALTIVATAGLVAASVLPIGAWGLHVLEQRFPAAQPPADVAGIIVLGGAVEPLIAADTGRPALNDAAERLTTLPGLAARYPEARLIFTGGSGMVLNGAVKEAPVAAAAWAEMGFDPGRVLYESDSRNTWENAVITMDLVRPSPGSRWVLVTSAAHMPRAVGVFRKAGWSVVPYPVDWTVARADLTRPVSGPAIGLGQLRQAVREFVGLAAYRLMGRSDSLFPGPSPRP